MAQGSAIEWTDATWNPVAGCTPVSPGCLNCYAARMALRLAHMPNGTGRKYAGTARRARDGRPVFTGRINLDEESLDLPRSWRLPRIIFVNSMSDLFHEAVPVEYIRRVFRVMNECARHTFQILTKRPEQALDLASEFEWSPNIWMGTSVETAKYYGRIAALREIPARVRFLSCEPLLGPLTDLPLRGVHWVIVGGESGPGARPMEAEWVRALRGRCEERGVAFFFKQWGGVKKSEAGRVLDRRTCDEMPLPAMAKEERRAAGKNGYRRSAPTVSTSAGGMILRDGRSPANRSRRAPNDAEEADKSGTGGVRDAVGWRHASLPSRVTRRKNSLPDRREPTRADQADEGYLPRAISCY